MPIRRWPARACASRCLEPALSRPRRWGAAATPGCSSWWRPCRVAASAAPAWALAWLALFAGLGWLGATAKPVFDEVNPVRPQKLPQRVVDAPLSMVDLPGGSFRMGSSAADGMASGDDTAQHAATLSPFHMAITPVTVALYREIMQPAAAAAAAEPSGVPATGMSWTEAVDFCNRLSRRAGYRPCYSQRFGCWRWRCDWRADSYRLPTEAEWEYACRAGSTTGYCYGDDPAGLDAYAWHAGNSDDRLQPVATKRANAWGLHNLHGNVWEWCWDAYGKYSARSRSNRRGPIVSTMSNFGRRVFRGGSFVNSPVSLRFACRIAIAMNRVRDYGFRCVRVPPQR